MIKFTDLKQAVIAAKKEEFEIGLPQSHWF